jgi:hypothetical protein
VRGLPEDRCRRNLRKLYVVSRKVPAGQRAPAGPPLPAIRAVLSSQFFLTPADWGYLRPGSRSSRPGATGSYGGPELEVLVCPQDPDYPYKIGRALAGSSAFEPSYAWTPTPGLLATCPYHGLALEQRGRVTRRRTAPGPALAQ